MKFRNRAQAGQELAKQLSVFADREDVIVLGLPRGGVPVASKVAEALHAKLDIFLSRKLGVPGNEELAFGAVSSGGGRYLDERIVHSAHITTAQISSISARARSVLERHSHLYRGDKPALSVRNKIAILVDDGIATGASLIAAVRALRELKPARVVVAAPVAPAATCVALQREADMVVVLETPKDFYAVGQFYDDFSPTSDDEVIALLQNGPRQHDGQNKNVSIPFDDFQLSGVLSLVPGASTLVVFVHGSGSTRFSPRNKRVAEILNRHGVSTLLFDLLTQSEEQLDARTAALRFNIELLTDRLLHVIDWASSSPQTAHLSISLFGASTGAAAALRAAAVLGDTIASVVSRGGRPDLAGNALAKVQSPTLLLVGGRDEAVLDLNRRALQIMTCEKQLAIVPGATHLFEEPGALDKVAELASNWVTRWRGYHAEHPELRAFA